MVFVRNFLEILVLVVWGLVLVRVVLSWIDPTVRNTPSRYVVAMTEPLLAPIRRLLPRTGMVDFSPLILMLVLAAILRVVSL